MAKMEDWSKLTPAEIRARVKAAGAVAMDRFERDWGTRAVQVVGGALRATIAESSDPADWARRTHARLNP